MRSILVSFPCLLWSNNIRHRPTAVIVIDHQHPHDKFVLSPFINRRHHTSLLTTLVEDLPDNPRDRALHAFSIFAKKDRSWRRFRHMVDLAMDSSMERNEMTSPRSIVDVGTDHGFLAGALAATGKFDKVVGVDVSLNALNNGGFALLKRINDSFLIQNANEENGNTTDMISSFARNSTNARKDENVSCGNFPLEFRQSDGLQKLHKGEADLVCIAGMGVNVMKKILLESTSVDGSLEIDRLACQRLILQPTNSRPRNLIQLYDSLQQNGWTLSGERIEHLSGRWYISCCFVRQNNVVIDSSSSPLHLPTSKLALLSSGSAMEQVVHDYWIHHLAWMQKEEKASKGNLCKDDSRWREWVHNHCLPNLSHSTAQ